MKRKLWLLIFVPLILSLMISLIPMAQAEEEPDIDLLDLPQKLADHIGISLFTSQILISLSIMFTVALPLCALRAKGLLILIGLFCTMGFLIAIAWLPYWIMLLTGLIVIGLYLPKIKKMI